MRHQPSPRSPVVRGAAAGKKSKVVPVVGNSEPGETESHTPPLESTTQAIFQSFLKNIRERRWLPGAAIPSERRLIDEFGVSRIAIREALSMLRGLGVLDIGHGRRTRVRSVDSETFGQLLPLMLMSEGQNTFDQIFEVRLAIELASVYLAASRRTPAQLQQIQELATRFEAEKQSGCEAATETDTEFHLEIARSSGNPLFPILLEALAGFIAFAQHESCRADSSRSQRAVLAHEAITEAIRAGNPEWARAEMEAHLRFSMTRQIGMSPGS